MVKQIQQHVAIQNDICSYAHVTLHSCRLVTVICKATSCSNHDKFLCQLTRGSLVAKNRQSILVAIFPICLATSRESRDLTNVPPAQRTLLSSLSTLLCTSGCRAHRHRRWPSNPTALSTQRSLMHAACPSCGG